MSGANYFYCAVCDRKALYDHDEDETPDVVVMHPECLERDRADRAGSLREQVARDIETELAAAIRGNPDQRTRSPRQEMAYKISAHIARGGACVANPKGVITP